ncbi:hypothetical protein G5I_02070 [Acromyrmex echinatior]|uniref:Uncharacterized protein n=1 Tax=Acromyrmex echinatior TaxID=103372 RepID=F4W9C2_ACREC|nr:hypothetical protein G5I_02070 [Acromyrmex echinatior]
MRGRLRYIRGRDVREKREPTCAIGRRDAAHDDDPVCRLSGALHDAESTCINATGGRLLRAYPNVSGAALHLHSAWPGRSVRNCETSRSRCRCRVRFFERTFRVSVKSQNEGDPAFDREMDPIYWGYLVPCFVQSFVPWQIAATKSDVILEAFVPPGRKPMTPSKVDVSAAEASTSLVNNKSVALPTRSPRATGLGLQLSHIQVSRAHIHAYLRVYVRPTGLCKLGHDDVYRHKPKPRLRGVSSEFVGLEPAAREC